MNPKRKLIVSTWLFSLFTGIALLFWHNEWVYSLPTPVPDHYQAVGFGKKITLPGNEMIDDNKPLFLHFFNPVCPCSRFNLTHFKTLVKEYGEQVNFKMVVLSNKQYTAVQLQDKFGITIPIVFDAALADSCGVYSTPQAVIIDKGQQLYYRGNYNRTRYCTDKKSEYARMALEALIHKREKVIFDEFAINAYGCQLPDCTK